jgi:hypothetical protein
MAGKDAITAEFVRSILDYNPVTGAITWHARTGSSICIKNWNQRFAGTVAGRLSTLGYREISVLSQRYPASHLAWLYMTGEWPKDEIDHRDLNKDNNAFLNLREATRGQNVANTGIKSNNTSGLKGVSWHKATSKWTSQITKHGHHHHLGSFDCRAAASFVFQIEADKLHGEFARTS